MGGFVDAALLILGVVAGVLFSALPGLHVNLLATAILVALPEPRMAPFLVAAFAAAPFGLALSATFLGGPVEEAALSSLPAHALRREGRAREAVALQTWGALLGILLALPMALALRLILVPLAPRLAAALPWILLGAIVLLVLSERRRLRWPKRIPWGERVRADDIDLDEGSVWLGRAAALGLILLSGALGFAALRLGARSPLGWPSSSLLPLLAGLFALPSLVMVARWPPDRARVILTPPPERLGDLARAAWPGAAVSAIEGLIPGISPSQAAILAPRPRGTEMALVRMAAVNGGAVVFTLAAWHALGKARAGALVAAGDLAPIVPWPHLAPPPAVLSEAALVVAAALVALFLARACARPLARAPPRPLALAGIAIVLASVALLNGALGLVELSVAGLVGAIPLRLGLRRSHLMGAILVPTLLRLWGIA